MAWSFARRTVASERAMQTWRTQHPDRAAIRDALLSTVVKEKCLCGSEDARLFVTDYNLKTYIWRCTPCAAAAREKFKAEREATE